MTKFWSLTTLKVFIVITSSASTGGNYYRNESISVRLNTWIEDFGDRCCYLGHGLVVTSYSILWDVTAMLCPKSLLWRHNGHDDVSNHQPHDCLLNRSFRRRSKKTSKLGVTGLCAGNSPVTGEFPTHMNRKGGNISIWWRCHVDKIFSWSLTTLKVFILTTFTSTTGGNHYWNESISVRVNPWIADFGDRCCYLGHGLVITSYSILWDVTAMPCPKSLLWRHNGHDGVSNHQPHDCLLNRSFRRRSKKTSKLHITGLYAGNSPVTGEFPAQRAGNAENVSIWWRHHDGTKVLKYTDWFISANSRFMYLWN